jgi:hypothetical protein
MVIEQQSASVNTIWHSKFVQVERCQFDNTVKGNEAPVHEI